VEVHEFMQHGPVIPALLLKINTAPGLFDDTWTLKLLLGVKHECQSRFINFLFEEK